MLIARKDLRCARGAVATNRPRNKLLEQSGKLLAHFRSNHSRGCDLPAGEQDDLALREIPQFLGGGHVNFRAERQRSDQMVAGPEYRNGNHIEQPIPDANGVGLFLAAQRSGNNPGTGGLEFRKWQERVPLGTDD